MPPVDQVQGAKAQGLPPSPQELSSTALGKLKLGIGPALHKLADLLPQRPAQALQLKLLNLGLPSLMPSKPTPLRTHFEQPPALEPQPALTSGLMDQPAVGSALTGLATALKNNEIVPANDVLVLRLGAALHTALDKSPLTATERLQLSLSTGATLLGQLEQGLRELGVGEGQLLTAKDALERAVNLTLGQIGDKVLGPVNDPLERIEVNGKTYQREMGGPLGSGNFGVVYKYVNVDDATDQVVLKQSTHGTAQQQMNEALAEGRMAVHAMGTGASIRHVAQLEGLVRTPDAAYTVFRFEDRGSMEGLLGKLDDLLFQHVDPGFSEQELAQLKILLCVDLSYGLQRMQEAKGVLHNDVATRNVLVDGSLRAKLGDFGLSKALPQGGDIQTASMPKPPGPMPTFSAAPESMMPNGQVTQKADSFMFGQTLAELAFGQTLSRELFGNSPMAKVIDPTVAMTVPAIPRFRLPGIDTEGLRALIQDLVNRDPAQRPSMEEARTRLLALIEDVDAQALRSKFVGVLNNPPQPAPSVLASPVLVVNDLGYIGSSQNVAPPNPIDTSQPMHQLLSMIYIGEQKVDVTNPTTNNLPQGYI